MTTSGFLRAGRAGSDLPRVGPGPPWTFDEADRQAHAFLEVLAGGRELPEHHDDPVEHARANGLMLLFSSDVQDAFETLLSRMPEPRVEAWRDLIAGGASSEAFGPLTLQERLDERQVVEALQAGRKQRIAAWAGGAVVLLAMLVGVWAAIDFFFIDDGRTTGALRFGSVDDDPVEASVVGGQPLAEPALTQPLATMVAVLAGDGPRSDRVATAPFAAFPYPPGALTASLFQYAASGQVVVVGPEGFAESSCLRASVVTSDLRPLDVVTHGPCAQAVGRAATVGCVGPTAILMDLRVPEGEVALPEGGTGFADAVRVQLRASDDRYEVLSLRATIEVDPDSEVTVPRFGGDPGDELTFDLGAERVGVCTLTGELPGVE